MELHRWRRRGKQSLYKLLLLEDFVKNWQKGAAPCEEMDLHLQDIQHVADQIRNCSESLQGKGQIITTMIQILDSRRSIEEVVNVRQLTNIVLVFIPLSFAVSIFGMGDDYGPGKEKFWIYFATAIPPVLLILTASMLSTQLQVLWSSFRAHRILGLGQRNRTRPVV